MEDEKAGRQMVTATSIKKNSKVLVDIILLNIRAVFSNLPRPARPNCTSNQAKCQQSALSRSFLSKRLEKEKEEQNTRVSQRYKHQSKVHVDIKQETP